MEPEDFNIEAFADILKEEIEVPVEIVERSKLSNETRVILPWGVSLGFLEGTEKEKEKAHARLVEVVALQAATDFNKLLIHGDTNSRDPLLVALDGIKKLEGFSKNKKNIDKETRAKYTAYIAVEEFETVKSGRADEEKFQLHMLVKLEKNVNKKAEDGTKNDISEA